jgi:hypothetical protein
LDWRIVLALHCEHFFFVAFFGFLGVVFFAAEFNAGFEVTDSSSQSSSAVSFGCYRAPHLASFFGKELAADTLEGF